MNSEFEAQNPKPSYQFRGDAPPAPLAHLGDKRRWVAWGYVCKKGRWTKPPINPHTGRLASVTNPATWGTFVEALECARRHGLAGVGVVLTGEEDDIVGGDLDHCITDAGTFSPLAAEILGYAETYAEFSPSSEGIRFFARGKIEKAVTDKAAGIEIYNSGRYLTVTGQHLPDTPAHIAEAPRTVRRLIEAAEAEATAKRQARRNGSDNGHARVSGDDFFGNVNAAALARLDDWFPILIPTARKFPNGAFRVTSEDLGRNLEEDLSAHPSGIRDHGKEEGLTPIDAVMKYGDVRDPTEATAWLCAKLGIDPATLGWKQQTGSNGHAPHGDAGLATEAKRPASQKSAAEDDPHWQVEPWPHPVSGEILLKAICATIKRYMALGDHVAETIALWILHDWALPAFYISPYLVVVSPTKQCGKTTLLAILMWLTPRSVMASNISASAIYRYIDDRRDAPPTLLIDEADSFTKEDDGIRNVLNSGHTKPGAYVIRCESEGKSIRTRKFSTWAPKIIASIGKLAGTVMDRSLIVRLRRKGKSEKVERFELRDTAEFSELRRMALRWAEDNIEALEKAKPDLPADLFNRPADNWRPLLAVADAAGGTWPELARKVALALSGTSSDRGVELLQDIRRVFDETRSPWLPAKLLCQHLNDLEDGPWSEYRNGKPITPRGVHTLLEQYEIASKKERSSNNYYKTAFEEAWSRYCLEAVDLSSTSSTT